MPIYEYRCPQCGERFDKLMRLGAEVQVRCPRCDSDKPQRLISLVAHTSSGSSSIASYSSSSAGCNTGT